jgi:hypothetical protein
VISSRICIIKINYSVVEVFNWFYYKIIDSIHTRRNGCPSSYQKAENRETGRIVREPTIRSARGAMSQLAILTQTFHSVQPMR